MYSDWHACLNPQQHAAATAGPQPLLIIAGAGTGKTNTLAHRVAHLIATGTDPGRILLLTFTRRAAAEMLRRVERILAQGMGGSGFGGRGSVVGERRNSRPEARINDECRSPNDEAGNWQLATGNSCPIENQKLKIENPTDSALSTQHSALARLWGGTFHAVANRLLRMHARAAGLGETFTVIDRSDSEDLIDTVRAQLGFHRAAERFPRKGTCLAIYSRCVNAQEPVEQALRTHFPWLDGHAERLKALFRAYTAAKQEQNVLDYDDLLLYWYHLMQDPAAAAAVRDRFDAVLVDEYQDTNLLQAQILRQLRPDGRGLTVVGDDAQSIYSFRAATVRNILDFPADFPGAVVIKLEQNYRSVQSILDAANAVMALCPRRYHKRLYSTRASAQKPRLVTLIDEAQQSDYLVGRILEHYEEGIPLRRQAVLFRAAHHSDALEVELARRNIPFVKYGGLKFLEAAHVKDVLCILRLAENPRDATSAFRVLQLLDGIGPTHARRAIDHLCAAGWDLRSWRSFRPPPAAEEQWRELVGLMGMLGGGHEGEEGSGFGVQGSGRVNDEIRNPKSEAMTNEEGRMTREQSDAATERRSDEGGGAFRLQGSGGVNDEIRNPKSEAMTNEEGRRTREHSDAATQRRSDEGRNRESLKNQKSKIKNPPPPIENRKSKIENALSDQIAAVRRFYEPILHRRYDQAQIRARDLEQLQQISSNFASRSAMLAELTLDPPAGTQDLAGPPLLDEDYLILSTIHSAKGCEWDCVYVIHAADGNIPSDMATGSEEEVEEERRLFYVALTRARDFLEVCFPLRYYHKKWPTGDRHTWAQRTRFLPESVLEHFECISLQSPLPADASSSHTPPIDVRARIASMWM
jgi:DNA helicase-2/ATP-dependent DNA helicase PcrA